MKRLFALFLVAGLLLVGAAGCSSDSDGGDKSPTTAADDKGDDSSGGGDSASSDVGAFCDSVEAYVKEAKAVAADPSSGDAQALIAQGQELASQAAELTGKIASGGLSEEEQKDLTDCQKQLTDASAGG